MQSFIFYIPSVFLVSSSYCCLNGFTIVYLITRYHNSFCTERVVVSVNVCD